MSKEDTNYLTFSTCSLDIKFQENKKGEVGFILIFSYENLYNI